MSGSPLENLPNIWEALPDIRKWSGGPTKCPGVVGSPSQMSEKPSRMSRSDREALSDVQEWSGDPPG